MKWPAFPFFQNATPKKMAELRVFISYAKKDIDAMVKFESLLFDKFKKFGLNEYEFELDLWWDRKIAPGAEWDNQLKARMQWADVVIFLITDHFFESEYIQKTEIKIALDLYEKNKLDDIICFAFHPKSHHKLMQHIDLKKFEARPKERGVLTSYIDEEGKSMKPKLFNQTMILAFEIACRKVIDTGKKDTRTIRHLRPLETVEFDYLERLSEYRIGPVQVKKVVPDPTKNDTIFFMINALFLLINLLLFFFVCG